jgi:enoyl-CoA hydratase/carnithine racemase
MLLCWNLVVAGRTASFGLPEVKRGLMPDFGGAFRAARLLPANVAREMLLTGGTLTAERAERLGLVNLAPSAPSESYPGGYSGTPVPPAIRRG